MQRTFDKIDNDPIDLFSDEEKSYSLDDEEIIFSGSLKFIPDINDKFNSNTKLVKTVDSKSIQDTGSPFDNLTRAEPKVSTYSNLNVKTVNNFTLQKYIKNIKPNHNSNLNSTNSTLISKYCPIINKKSIEDLNCDVCGDEYSWEDDEIVVCELCNFGVHQGCYGGEIYDDVPDSKWYCQRCEHLTKFNWDYKKIKCYLCPDYCGIMKKFGNKWFHIDCVNWTPEIYFEDDLKSKINLTSLNSERFDCLMCNICKIKEGSCIQCDYKDCNYSFHVRCGKKTGMIESWEEMEKYQNDCYIPIFCKHHRKIVDNMNLSEIKNLYKFHKFSDEDNESGWTDKEGSASDAKEEGLIMVDGDYEVIGVKYTQQKRGRGRPRKIHVPNANCALKKKILFTVNRNVLQGLDKNPINMNKDNLNKQDSSLIIQNPKTNDSIKQRIFLQNNFNNCKTSTKTFFERENKLKYLGFKN